MTDTWLRLVKPERRGDIKYDGRTRISRIEVVRDGEVVASIPGLRHVQVQEPLDGWSTLTLSTIYFEQVTETSRRDGSKQITSAKPTETPTPAVPDLTEPIVAVRGWKARRITERTKVPGYRVPTDGGLLSTANRDVVWPVREPLEARCLMGATHPAPAPQCACGIYAVASPQELVKHAEAAAVFGLVQLWGRVVPGEHGWRAQFARPVAFVTDGPSLRVRRLSRLYDVPVIHSWPELTDPKEVARWTSAASTR